MKISLMLVALYLLASRTDARDGFVDHGSTLPLAALRGAIAMQNSKGENLVIACSMDTSPQGWILVTNIDTGESRQVWVPERYPNSPPYGSILGSNGRFYTCEGSAFLEFDPDIGDWSFHSPTADGCYIGATEGPDGTIYFGGCPGTHLIAFDPKTRTLTDYGRMDPHEQYLNELATDSAGWVYCGIGTARENLVAFNPRTGERRQLIAEQERQTGSASVEPGADGKAYATVRGQRLRLFNGEATPIDASEVAPRRAVYNINWGQIISTLPDGRTISQYNMIDKYIVVAGPAPGEIRRVALDYVGDGSRMTCIAAGPDGKVWGGAAFPCSVVAYDPKVGGSMQRIGDLYWHCFASSGTLMAAGRYAGGYLYLFDTARPWSIVGDDKASNPRPVGQYAPDVNAPTAVVFHPDGRHVLMAGLPGYGYRGGGVAIYDMVTEQSQLIPHTELVPDQSIVSLRVLADGSILCGSSTQGGHGTEATAGEARLLVLDWETKQVAFRAVPVRGAQAITDLELGANGLVYGLADGHTLFVFDPVKRRVVRRQDLSQYGTPVRNAVTRGGDGSIYVLVSGAILRIGPGSRTAQKLADTPAGITQGIALAGDRLYFVCFTRLWSYGPV